MKKENKGIRMAMKMAGSGAELARMLGVMQPTIYHYLQENCPAERAMQVHKLFKIPLKLLRPDLWQ